MKDNLETVSASSSSMPQQVRNDPLRRFTPTPYATLLPVMGRSVCLETNSPSILQRMLKLFARYPKSETSRPDFLWRIVSQSDVQMFPPWPRRTAFSGHGLRSAEFGQRNFLAVDIGARHAIAFLADGLVKDRLGFTSPFLDNLFCMTAGSLGLVSLRANCLTLGNKGLLVFGPHNSGKTTASYIAARRGFKFYADEGVFAEIKGDRSCVWGGFWPPAFRAEALQFLPELKHRTRPFSYCDSNFYHFSKPLRRTNNVLPVRPVCCVFLERETSAVPRLSPVNTTEFRVLLAQNLLFKDDDRFASQHTAVLTTVEKLPVYRLAYDSNPAAAAPFLQAMLLDHDIS
jgi:hypothetical protein